MMNKLTIAMVVVVVILALLSITIKSQPKTTCSDISVSHNELIQNILNGKSYADDSAEMKAIKKISDKCSAELKSKDIDKVRCKAVKNLQNIVELTYLNITNNSSKETYDETIQYFTDIQNSLKDSNISSCESVSELQSAIKAHIKSMELSKKMNP